MALRDLFQWRTYSPPIYSRSEVLQKNEQIRTLSLFANNAGLALIVAGAARWFEREVDGFAIFWLIGGGVAMSISLFVCSFLLEAER